MKAIFGFEQIEGMMSIRLRNCLRLAGISNRKDLLTVDIDNLLKNRNFGLRSAQELRDLIDKLS